MEKKVHDHICNHQKFDADKITKYFRDQAPYVGDEQFKDPFFPPNDNSILAKNADGSWIGDSLRQDAVSGGTDWKTPKEIFKSDKFVLFEDKIECDDIKQGNLGNCYFLSALAAMTEYPKLVYQIFRTKDTSIKGYYEICLFIDGEWQIVILDDFFPVLEGTNKFKFAKPNGNELWVILLEKAWAKVNGGYRNTISGKPNEALNALTGFPSERYNIHEMEEAEVWKLVLKADKSDNIMCTSTISDKSVVDMGLVVLHAYTLVETHEVAVKDQKVYLVRIRNPWGNKEWNGDWSDKSDKWTDELKKEVGFNDEDDGTFFMCISDYHRWFNYISICSMMPESNVKTFKFDVYKKSPPNVYNLYLPEDRTLALSAIDRHWRYNRQLTNKDICVYMLLASYDDKSVNFIDGDFSSTCAVDMIQDLKQGNYAIWIWCDWENSFEESKPECIKVLFSSQCQFSVKQNSFDEEAEFASRIICSGISQEKDITIKENFNCIANQFKKSGLGYLAAWNNSDSKMQIWTCNASGLLNMSLLPPWREMEIDNFTFVVPPKSSIAIIGNRLSTKGKYWFNIKSTFKNAHLKDPNPPRALGLWCDTNISTIMTDDNFYDYCSSELSKSQPNNFVVLSEVEEFEVKAKLPELTKLLQDIPELNDGIQTTWKFIEFGNGKYVGQMYKNSRHGKGAYHFNNESGYFGQWVNNQKEGFGCSYRKGFILTYKGDFKKGKMHGLGEYYFSNGDIVKCQYVEDKKQGPGIYLWKNGAKWTGYFENNLLHGDGEYIDPQGNKRNVSYRNGKIVSE